MVPSAPGTPLTTVAMRRIYVDHAATSWPKPTAVCDAVDRYQRDLGAPAGRGTYAEAIEVDRLVGETRRRVAKLLGTPDPRQVVFTYSGTDALNQAIYGLVTRGSHVIATEVEHNSVLRPLRALEASRDVESFLVPCDGCGVVSPDDLSKAIRANTSLIVLTQASNVTGALQPVAEVAGIAREHGIPLLVDAAQSLGHGIASPVGLGATVVAAPGHKGCLGPLGTGILFVDPQWMDRLEPLRRGGTGTQSESDLQPESMPDRYEAGNLNVPGLVGLGAGLKSVLDRGAAELREHQIGLTRSLLEGLAEIPQVTMYGPREAERRVGVVSIGMAEIEPQDLAAILESSYRIQVRAGLHCAPRMHGALGTLRSGGTVRISFGPSNSQEDVTAILVALREIAGGFTA